MKINDINDALNIELDSEDYDSVGGLIIEKLERLPQDKEIITLENGITLQADSIEDNRIQKVLITLPDSESEDTEEVPEES